MTDIPKFTAQAPRRGIPSVDERTGAPQALAGLASAAAQLAGRLGGMVEDRVKQAALDASAADALAVEMPGVDFAFTGASQAAPSKGRAAPKSAGGYKSYLMSKHGLSDTLASAAIGRLIQESGLRATGAVGDAGTAFGMAQWRGDRLARLKAFAGAGWTDPYRQLDFMVHELKTTEGAAGRKFFAATTLEAAAEAMMDFERPQGWTPGNPRAGHGWTNTLANARRVAGVTAPATVTATPARMTPILTGARGALPRMEGDSLAARTYNANATEIYLSRLDTAMRGQMLALETQHADNPAALAEALDAMKAGLTDGLPPQAVALVQRNYETARFSAMTRSADAFQTRMKQEASAAFEENFSARTTDAVRLALAAAKNGEADTRLDAALAELDGTIDASPLAPADKARHRADAREQVLAARIEAGYDAQPAGPARAAYVKAFQDDFAAGQGRAGGLDATAYGRINSGLVSRLAKDDAERARVAAAADKAIGGQLDFLEKGFTVNDGQRRSLREAAAATGDPAVIARADFLDGLANWQSAHVKARPEAVTAQIDALNGRIAREGASENALTALKTMEALRDTMERGLKTDPLAFAARAGVTKVEPLDFSDGPRLAASLTERVADAEAVSRHYGVAPRFFTSAETDALKKTLDREPLALPSLASALATGLGPDAPRALAELSDEAPLLAHVGGLVAATGDQRAAVDIAEALAARKEPGYKSRLPTARELDGAAAAFAGDAFAGRAEGYQPALDAATALYERRALARGLDPSDLKAGPAADLFEQAFDEALGARMIGGVKHGGLAEVNGHMTVAPPDLPADDLQALLSRLSADDLADQVPLGTANGIPIALSALRRARLVAVTPGRYRLALGDMEGGDPRFVPDAAGGVFELDALALKRSQDKRGAGRFQLPFLSPF